MLPMQIGRKIRALRQQQQLSIEQLSDLTELSTGSISQIERDLVGLSVESLWRIANALGVPIGYFFDEAASGVVVRKSERRQIVLPQSNVVYELLSPDMNRRIEFLLVRLQQGDSADHGQISHAGEECGLVLQGELIVRWGDQEFYLQEGDSIYFASSIPHRFKNPGYQESVSVWAMTPPSF
jgi:transcriptional regulator with XRE-family HTH domain